MPRINRDSVTWHGQLAREFMGSKPTPRILCVALLLAFILVAGCGIGNGTTLPNESTEPLPSPNYELVARFAHICDTQIIDEQSPARLAFAVGWLPAAWRPQESYSTQLLDGIIRAVNRYHEYRERIDFVIFGGDDTDNAQSNELRWFLDVIDGKSINPLSGPDDRPAELRPDPLLDPHAPFVARGLYRQGVHGDKPSVPWFNCVGNHDRFAQGIFPIVENAFGESFAPLPLPNRVGLILPDYLDPLNVISYARITPANPGPPIPSLPFRIPSNEDRKFFNTREWVLAHFDTVTGPPGHGFDRNRPLTTWYSAFPVPGLRLVVLDSCTPPEAWPAGFYSEGAIHRPQVNFLRHELQAATDAGQLALVVTHHQSNNLWWSNGSALTGKTFRELLNQYPCVVAHLTGHAHEHQVRSHGGYLELHTASTLDFPQEARIIEIWRRGDDVQLRYWPFSHIDPNSATLDPDGDPLAAMREMAFELSGGAPPIGDD